jgi:Spy/CpxP family protein refolding chaperone
VKTTTFTTFAETSFVRKTALGIAGLAFIGGAVAGPASHAFASPAEHTAAAPAMTTVAQVTSDKPGMDKLVPHGTQGAQSSIDLSKEQRDNAKAITDTAKKLGMGERGAVIAVATSMQESKLENLGHLGDMNDHDSLGLFQQRPSSGWGTPEQITDPTYASTAFLKSLKQVDGWQDMPLTDAAQKVQVSAFPDAYAQWENQAAHIVQDVWTK